MKLFNQFNVLPRYLTAFNYAGLNLNETPKELEKCTPKFQNFWDKECREHPTNHNCLTNSSNKIKKIRGHLFALFESYAPLCPQSR